MLFEQLHIYQDSSEAKAIQDGYQAAIDLLWDNYDMSEAQVFIASATWGLDLWEDYLGLEHSSASEAVRRERITSKLRGAGTTTKTLIEEVAASYANGEVEVVEDNANYQFKIRFISQKGQPAGLNELKDAIEEIKPAHLGVVYVFIYTTHNELKPYTHNALAAFTHDTIRTMEV